MEVNEKKIQIKNKDFLTFLSLNIGILESLQNRFEAILILRGDTLIIRGKQNEIELIDRIFNEYSYTYIKNGNLKETDIAVICDIFLNNNVAKNGNSSPSDKTNTNIIYPGYKEPIKARSPRQKEYHQKVLENDMVFAIGPAGTGKTFLAVAMALNALRNNEVSRIILSRPAVEAGESLGFLPGDLKEKLDPYLRPLTDALLYMLNPEKLKTMMDKNIIEIIPLAYMRGRTLSNSFIILDEAQNATVTQMKMFLTRMGTASKAVITGDITQIDLGNYSDCGLIDANRLLKDIKGIEFVYFDQTDVVRHRLVAEIINAYQKDSDKKLKKEKK
jgi:phosphate starvation-inducible PhoH-like protein